METENAAPPPPTSSWWSLLEQNVPEEASRLFAVLAIVALSAIAWALLSRALGALERQAKGARAMLAPARLALRYTLIVVALLLIVSVFGIPIGNFWTFISALLGLVAIGFVAVWSVLSNILSAVFIYLSKPFRVGDYIRVVGDEVDGEVREVNMLFTTLARPNGDVFSVPNNQFFQKSVLLPADPAALAASPEASVPDHSQQNLEGVSRPSSARSG